MTPASGEERVEGFRKVREFERTMPLSSGQLWTGADVDLILDRLRAVEGERDALKDAMVMRQELLDDVEERLSLYGVPSTNESGQRISVWRRLEIYHAHAEQRVAIKDAEIARLRSDLDLVGKLGREAVDRARQREAEARREERKVWMDWLTEQGYDDEDLESLYLALTSRPPASAPEEDHPHGKSMVERGWQPGDPV